MNIITENGKDYLETFVAKIDNQTLDCSPCFYDIENAVDELIKKYNKENKTHLSYLDSSQYGGTLQSILNRYSGEYFSPSFLKSYETNPASLFYSTFCEDDSTAATSIGSTFHLIMENFYKSETRTIEYFNQLCDELILPEQKEKIAKYISGILETPDYLTGNTQEFDIKCECETRGKTNIYIPKFNISLPACSYVVDRIDFRDDDIYIVDYKTGSVTNKNLTFDGNLAQMIIYKWVIEQQYDKEVKGVYICAPGNKKYMEVNCNDENQKILVDRITTFFDKFREDNARRVYTFTNEGYFTNRQMQEFREIMNDYSIKMAKIPVKIYLGEHKK